MKIEWIDHFREPSNPPDPKYPNGVHLDATNGAATVCTVGLPYPAKRCGMYIVECETCGQRIAITTAGRPDDPRSLRLGCKLVKPGH